MFSRKLATLMALVLAAATWLPLPAQKGLRLIDTRSAREVTGYADVGEQDSPAFSLVGAQDVYTSEIPKGPYQNIWGVFLGVGDYENYTDLKNPGNDARELAATLQNVSGLRDPIVLTDSEVSVDNLDAALREIGSKSGPGDLVVFLFSGHGVGLKDNATGEMRGYFLLSDTVPPEDIIFGRSMRGLVDMQRVRMMMELAGIRSKHQLIVLDCCFSGFGAENRPGTRGVFDRSIDTMLNGQAIYVMSAGNAGQEVLDISVDYEGYGLLTGFLIQALQNPTAFGLRPMDYRGQKTYISTMDLFQQTQLNIPIRAGNTLQYFVDAISDEVGITPVPQLEDLTPSRIATYPEEVRDVFGQLMTLSAQLQNPQALRLTGPGTVLLPVKAVTDPPKVTPTLPPPPTPTATPKPNAPTPTATVTPTVTPVPTVEPSPTPLPPGVRPFWSIWAQDAGKHYGDPEYGNKLERVLQLIYEGVPPEPKDKGADLLRLAADVFARPIIENDTWRQIYAYEGQAFAAGTPPERILAWREGWREAHDIGWKAIPHKDYMLSDNYQYRFRVANFENSGLHYYMIGLDEAGMLQWLAPENPTWKDDMGNFSSGRSPLAKGEEYIFPPPDPKTGAPGFQNVEGQLDQYFFLVACREPWPELEQALMDACPVSFRLFNSKADRAAQPINSTSRLEFRTRAAGRVQVETLDDPPEKPTIDYITVNKGHYRIMTWLIDIVPPDQLQPMVVVD